jgi:uncharacterized membrane protein (DUF4010 family)
VVTARAGDVGITTEVSALLAFLLGVLAVRDEVGLAAGLAVASTLVLALREWLHGLARRIETADVEATLKFGIVTLIVLPLVPNQNFGPPPFDVINPHKIWLMVTLISGLNFAGYLLVKVVGTEHGLSLTGLLGGLVSSTAVTLGFSQRSRGENEPPAPLALGILLAWTVMFVRVVVLTGVIQRELGARLALAMALLGGLSLAICLVLRRRASVEKGSVGAGANPFELGQAIKFGLVFGAVTLAAKAAQVYLGTAGVYLAAAVSGLTDVDAIALSVANLAANGTVSLDVGARAVLIAVLANTLAKGAMAVVLGSRGLRRVMLPAAGVLLVAGTLVAVLA